MDAWQLNESRGIGGSDRVWRLRKEGDGLTVGRAAYCDIQVLSQSVEKKHSVIKWDERKGSYVIHDLGSSNGTFLNDLPLSNGVATLRDGDILRFGYDKGHLFHVKKVEAPQSTPACPPPHQSSPPPSSSSSSTQTSPEQHHAPQPPPPPPQVTGGVQYVTIASPSASIILPPGQPYLLQQPIYTAHVPHIGHVTGHLTTSSPLVTGYVGLYGSPTPLPSTPLHLLPSYPLTPHPSTPHNRDAPSSSDTSLSAGVHIKGTESTGRAEGNFGGSKGNSVVGGGGEKTGVSSVTPAPRRDGRRAVSLSSANMPRLSEVSSLYGSPSWWAGDNEGEAPVVTKAGGDSPRKPAKRSEPQILRNISPPPLAPSGSFPTRPLSTRATPTGEDVGDSTSDIETNVSSAWTVETGPPRRSRAVPPKWRRHIRSADSSPIRTPPTGESKNRSVSPNVTPLRSSRNASGPAKAKESTPLSQRMPAGKPHSSSTSSGSKQRPRPGTSPVRRMPRSSSLRTPRTQPWTGRHEKQRGPKQEDKVETVVAPRSTRARTERISTTAVASEDKVELSPPPRTSSSIPSDRDGERCELGGTSGEEGVGSQSEGMLAASGDSEKPVDETFVVTSPPDEEEGRTGSARKTWNSQSQQNSLVMASIEARVKRLDSMARKVYLSLSTLEEQEQGRMSSREAVVCSSPLAPTPTTTESETHHMPEWKFFDKDVDSIFKSIRSVEKWLKDIDVTVGRLQQQSETNRAGGGGGEREGEEFEGEGEEEGKGEPEEGVAGSKHVDFPVFSACTSESEGTEFHDSIEDGEHGGISD